MGFFPPKKYRNNIKGHKSCELYKAHSINFEILFLRQERNGSKNAFVKNNRKSMLMEKILKSRYQKRNKKSFRL